MTPAKKFTYWLRWRVKAFLYFPDRMSLIFCLMCEKYFRRIVLFDSCPSNTSLHKLTQSVVQSFVNKQCFASLSQHMLDCDPLKFCCSAYQSCSWKVYASEIFLCWKAIYCCTSWQAQESKSTSEHKISYFQWSVICWWIVGLPRVRINCFS